MLTSKLKCSLPVMFLYASCRLKQETASLAKHHAGAVEDLKCGICFRRVSSVSSFHPRYTCFYVANDPLQHEEYGKLFCKECIEEKYTGAPFFQRGIGSLNFDHKSKESHTP